MKNKEAKNKMKALIKKIYGAIYRRIIWNVCYFLPVNKEKIVVSSFYGKGYGDNPKVVSRIMRKKVCSL